MTGQGHPSSRLGRAGEDKFGADHFESIVLQKTSRIYQLCFLNPVFPLVCRLGKL